MTTINHCDLSIALYYTHTNVPEQVQSSCGSVGQGGLLMDGGQDQVSEGSIVHLHRETVDGWNGH